MTEIFSLNYNGWKLGKLRKLISKFTNLDLIPTTFSLATLSNEGYKFYSIMIVVFLIFSHICPTETTTIQSFAYTSLWSWNVGVKKFDLQVLLLVLYHINWFDQLSHMTLLGDLLAW